MRITFLTLFPEMYQNFTETSIIGRAISENKVSVDFVNIRDFALDKYKHVDDTPYGGGAGMIMKCQPVLDALNSVRNENSHVVLFTAGGKQYNQSLARKYVTYDHLILLCGHYEGMDARIEKHVDEVISIGDYVLTGGELASMVVADSVIRLIDGVIQLDSINDESYENGLLEYPQYTKPQDYNGEKIPEVLASGDHEKIRKWRKTQSLVLTREKRKDLFDKYILTEEDIKLLKAYDDKIKE
jgi:tRNA (guanine37-N1)-methyltransferase